MLKKFWIITFLLFTAALVYGTHNRAGEISFEQLDELTIRVTITTYTKTSSSSADRDSLELFWGDGTSEFVTRSNGQGETLDNDVKLNTYVADHLYPGINTYTIYFMDPNRVENILNVNPPNSVDVPFYLETTFTFLNPQFQGINNSPKLLQAPLDFACVGQPFQHNPNAFDPDGDSLAYELIIPLQMANTPVPDYRFPDQIAPGLDNIISLNEITGDLRWNAPKIQGEYNIAILVKEYRDGVLISSLIRDMQIFVRDCDNRPPSIETIDEICVIAGTRLELDVIIDDPDAGQLVSWTASGGPFELNTSPPAELLQDSIYSEVLDTTQFIWQTRCEDIRQQSYQVVIRAVDNFLEDTGLASLKTIRIKVVGPPPENLMASSENEAILLRWDFPYACQQTDDDFFQGFSVWRKLLSTPFVIDTCVNGLEGRGYTKIEFNTNENDGTNYSYLDENVEKGKTYCYRVLAEFALSSPTGNPFNRIESLSSAEVCLQLSRDLPIITEVSIESTDNASGQINISWARPLSEDLDTLMFPGPYTYRIMAGTSPVELFEIPNGSITSNFLLGALDTMFRHENLNTEQEQYYYQIDFLTGPNQNLYGSSQYASSVFLSSEPNDKRVELSWDYDTPWQNYLFKISRLNATSGLFDSLDITDQQLYIDRDLINDEEYCYKIEAIGTYGLENLIDPLINFSQEVCETPIDLEPPCPPELEIESLCDKLANIIEPSDLINSLSWSNPNEACLETSDVSFYSIYISFDDANSWNLLSTVEGDNNLTFDHLISNGQLGCYAVSATDFRGNESVLSNFICIDNCPLYELPNTFTPNGDSANDLFVPIKNIFVERVNFKVYNRWGNLIFETTDPVLNWNGNNLKGDALADGTYYYTCDVFEQSNGAIVEAIERLSGYIHLIRG